MNKLTAKPKSFSAKGHVTRNRIIETAARLMLKQGVERTTIEEIQNSADVSTSQMYHYFSDKQSLVLAVIDFQSEQVLSMQRQKLDKLDSFEALEKWRDLLVDNQLQQKCVGGCPIGSMASELAETDPLARGVLAKSFERWEDLLVNGLKSMQSNGTISLKADANQLALAILAAVQGGLLLTQLRRNPMPLQVAIDTNIAYLRTLV